MKKLLFILLCLPLLFSSCIDLDGIQSKAEANKAKYSKNYLDLKIPKINYNNKNELDSLIKITPISKDTIFLGFIIGMNKNEYKSQIKKLRNEGKTITYSNSNSFTSAYGTFNLGGGYTFETPISLQEGNKTITGYGSYFLEPSYNNNGELAKLNILPIEKWDETRIGYKNKGWLENNILKNSERIRNNYFKEVIEENNLISSSLALLRVKNNVLIFESSPIISYVDLKTFYLELLVKAIERDIKIKESKKVTF